MAKKRKKCPTCGATLIPELEMYYCPDCGDYWMEEELE